MNCKAGDKAIIIKSLAGNEGKLVTCLQLIETDEECIRASGFSTTAVMPLPYWLIDSPLVGSEGILVRNPTIPDAWLIPIRPDDSEELIDITQQPLQKNHDTD